MYPFVVIWSYSLLINYYNTWHLATQIKTINGNIYTVCYRALHRRYFVGLHRGKDWRLSRSFCGVWENNFRQFWCGFVLLNLGDKYSPHVIRVKGAIRGSVLKLIKLTFHCHCLVGAADEETIESTIIQGAVFHIHINKVCNKLCAFIILVGVILCTTHTQNFELRSFLEFRTEVSLYNMAYTYIFFYRFVLDENPSEAKNVIIIGLEFYIQRVLLL